MSTSPVTGGEGRRAVWVVVPVAVVLSLLILLLATREPASERAVNFALRGEIAPLIAGQDLDGRMFDIDDHSSRWVVVNFFSTTCVPCVREHPELVEFHERHVPIGDVEVVSVAFDDSAANVVDFFDRYGGTWPVLTRDTGGVAVAYGVVAVPESYLVAPGGVVVEKIIGGVTADQLDALIDAYEAAA